MKEIQVMGFQTPSRKEVTAQLMLGQLNPCWIQGLSVT